MVIIAACSSSAHQLLDLLSDRCSFFALRLLSSRTASNAMRAIARRKDTQPMVPG
jgi:hypothetical protein